MLNFIEISSKKDITKKIKVRSQIRRKYVYNKFDKGPLSRIYKELLQLNNEKTNNRIYKNGQVILTGVSLKKIYRCHIKTCEKIPNLVTD